VRSSCVKAAVDQRAMIVDVHHRSRLQARQHVQSERGSKELMLRGVEVLLNHHIGQIQTVERIFDPEPVLIKQKCHRLRTTRMSVCMSWLVGTSSSVAFCWLSDRQSPWCQGHSSYSQILSEAFRADVSCFSLKLQLEGPAAPTWWQQAALDLQGCCS
jgi:hypothetical protein